MSLSWYMQYINAHHETEVSDVAIGDAVVRLLVVKIEPRTNELRIFVGGSLEVLHAI